MSFDLSPSKPSTRRTGESSFAATRLSAPAMSFAIFQRNSTNGALRTSNFTGKLNPLAADSARACTTTLPSSSTNAYFVGVLSEPKVSGSQPRGSAAPGLADEKGVTSGAASIAGCAPA